MAVARYDAAVIGLGAMGGAAAWHLARRGVKVIGFDRYHPPHSLGSTHGESRAIREAYYEDPSYVPFVRRAFELWDELSQLAGQELLTTTGAMMVGPENGSLIPGARASAEEHDIPHELMDAAEIRRRFPVMNAQDPLVGVLEHRAGLLDVDASVAAQLEQAAREGAELHFDEPLEQWRPLDLDDVESAIELRTSRGTVVADRVVLTAGAWNASLVRKLDLPLSVTRQVMMWFRPRAQPELFEVGRLPVWMWERAVQDFHYGFPNLGNGFKLGNHLPDEEVDPNGYDRSLRESDEQAMRDWLADTFPNAAGEMLHGETCLYTHTPDAHFLIDLHPKRPNISIASPCSGHGFKFAPAIGEALADLALEQRTRHDLHLFSVDRMVAPRVGAGSAGGAGD